MNPSFSITPEILQSVVGSKGSSGESKASISQNPNHTSGSATASAPFREAWLSKEIRSISIRSLPFWKVRNGEGIK